MKVPDVNETEMFTAIQFLTGRTVCAPLLKVYFFLYIKYYLRINSLPLKLNFKSFLIHFPSNSSYSEYYITFRDKII